MEEDPAPYEEEDLEGYLPNIYETAPSRNFRAKKNTSPARVRKDFENLFIYKDFDTSLTKVKTPIRHYPRLGQTTAKRPEDLIRDRLLSFNVNGGKLSAMDRGRSKQETINERTQKLIQRRKASQ